METRFPDITGVKGLFLPGFIKAGGAIRKVGSVIVKRSYDIDGGALVPTENDKELTLSDELKYFESDGDDVGREDAEDDADIVLVHAESDLAPFKPLADLVVRGAYKMGENAAEKAVKSQALVNGDIWFERDHSTFDLDMFGWAPKVGPSPSPPPQRSDCNGTYEGETPIFSLPDDFDNCFYNGHNRSFRSGASMDYFDKNAEVEVRRDIDDDNTFLTFNLGEDTPVAAYFHHCGHGRDEASRWCRVMVPFNLDTVIVHPDSNRCQLLWRGHWDFSAHPVEHYRLLTVQFEEKE